MVFHGFSSPILTVIDPNSFGLVKVKQKDILTLAPSIEIAKDRVGNLEV